MSNLQDEIEELQSYIEDNEGIIDEDELEEFREQLSNLMLVQETDEDDDETDETDEDETDEDEDELEELQEQLSDLILVQETRNEITATSPSMISIEPSTTQISLQSPLTTLSSITENIGQTPLINSAATFQTPLGSPTSITSTVTPVRSFAPTPVRSIVPTPTPVRSFAPTPIRSFAPTPVRSIAPTPVRSIAPTPVRSVAPIPVRSIAPISVRSIAPTPIRSFAPTPVRSIAPTPVRSIAPIPVRSIAPTPVRSVAPIPVRSIAPPVPVRSVAPIPVRSIAPTPVRSVAPTPVRSVAPIPVRSVAPPVPVRSVASKKGKEPEVDTLPQLPIIESVSTRPTVSTLPVLTQLSETDSSRAGPSQVGPSISPRRIPSMTNIEEIQVRVANTARVPINVAVDALYRTNFDAEKAIDQLLGVQSPSIYSAVKPPLEPLPMRRGVVRVAPVVTPISGIIPAGATVPAATPLVPPVEPPEFARPLIELSGFARSLIPGEFSRPLVPGELTAPPIPGELTAPPIPGAERIEPPSRPIIPPIQEVALPPRQRRLITPPRRPITSPVPTDMPFILPSGSTIIPTIPLSPPTVTPGAERALAQPFTIQQVVAKSKVTDIMVTDKKTDTKELLKIEKISGLRGKQGLFYRRDQLEDIASQLGLKHTGNKDELANRILSYLRQQGYPQI